MTDYLELDLGDSPESIFLDSLSRGQQLPASQLLLALEGAAWEDLEYVLEGLEDKQVTLVLDELPVNADAATAARLQWEAQLIREGKLLTELEASDPLRLYLEELAAVPVCGDLDILAQDLAGTSDPETPVCTAVFNLCISRVVELAGEFTGKGVLLADLIQEASLGLWSDLVAYSGGDFALFRDRSIRKYMLRAVISQAHEVGVGQKLRQAMEDYRSVDERLLAELGRNPTLEEIAEAMHLTPQQTSVVADMVDNARNMQRYKAPEETKPLPEEDDQAVEDTAYFQMRQRIADLLADLPEREAELLTLRYGLEGGLPLKPHEVASRLGLTSQQVNQLEAQALAKLRQK